MHDFVVVGAGMFGASYARTAVDLGYSCMVIDSKSHVAGAAHDSRIGTLNVSSYGAHIFHTNNEEVWAFANKYSQWDNYQHTVKALTGGKLYSLPLNMNTFNALWGCVTPVEAEEELKRRRIHHDNPRNAEEWLLSKVGEELYNLFFYGYTRKQYFRDPSKLPVSLVQRLPIRFTYDDRYFTAKYSAMPKDGYTSFVCNMLDGVEVQLNTTLASLGNWRNYGRRLVYSGPVDQLFNGAFGFLPYNSMSFRTVESTGDFQGTSVVNHCDPVSPYLRTIEYKHFKRDVRKHQDGPGTEATVVSYDLPCEYGEPLYPIALKENMELHAKYESAASDSGVILGGRLGEYRYYDMDQAIASGIQKARKACR